MRSRACASGEPGRDVIGEGLREARETLARLDLSDWEARLVYDRAVDYLGMTADLYLRARHLPRSDSAKRRLTDVILDLRRLGVRDLPAEEDVFEEIDERNASVHDGSITRSTRLQAGLTEQNARTLLRAVRGVLIPGVPRDGAG